MNRCVGCGMILQNVDKDNDGYVSDLDKTLCMRCFTIKNYGQNKAIKRTNDDYLNILKKIKDKDVVVYVSSILTLNLDYLDKFKNVILVLTKRDSLPKSVKDIKIVNYIKGKYNNIIDVIIVSAYKKYNLDRLYNKLNLYSRQNIYFVGITNSGKSTLINEMIKSYSGVDGKITTSAFPSTTLSVVDVKIGNLRIKDTPGIVISNSLVNYLDNKEIKIINSKKEIKPITIQIRGKGSVLIGNFFRIDYETELSSMTFYVANSVKIDNISLKNPRLLDGIMHEYSVLDNEDLVIEDMGFVKFTKETKISVYGKYDSYLYIRNNLI